ncbi:MAG TPA: ThuA domain-containing protein [Gemmataceae bacterium]|nr:ThuA domain-containing protein [Gemmataceae bacterium]
MLCRASALLTLACISCWTPSAPAQQKVPAGAKVLLLSGGQRDHHAYRRQAQRLQKILEDSRQFEVTICEDAAILLTPSLRKYDMLLVTADRRDPEFRLTEEQQRAMLNFVEEGKGLFSFHAFCCADKTWLPQMRELIGGVLSHVGTPDTKVRIGKYPVKIVDQDHPITRGLSDFEHEDELYYHLQTQGELKPLVVAVYEGKDWPILWTRSYGRGKVCVSVFGHCGVQPNAKDPLDQAPFRDLVLRGMAWTAGRELPAPSR